MDSSPLRRKDGQPTRLLWGRIFDGQITRVGYLMHSAIYATVSAVLIWPIVTFLWTSPILLLNVYRAFLVIFVFLLFLGFLSSYFKTTRGRGARWYWVIIFGFCIPLGIVEVSTYGKIVQIFGSNSYEVFPIIALLLFFCVPLFLKGTGPKEPFSVEDYSLKNLVGGIPCFIGLAAISVVIPVAVYAGFFQNGLWVGHKENDDIRYVGEMDALGIGTVIATCENLKGVTAFSQSRSGGFVRDGFEDTKFGVVVCQRRRDSAAFSRRKSAAGVEAIRPPISGALLYFSGHF